MELSSSDEELMVISLCLADDEEKKERRSIWVHPINSKRETFGEFHHLYPDLLKDDRKFFQYFRMGFDKFNELLRIIGPEISQQNSTFRRCIPTEERLAVCLRFFATGETFRTLSFNYRLGESTVRIIVYQVCDVIWKRLVPIAMPDPKREDWLRIGDEFHQRWNFPNCLGAVDGKHVLTDKPSNSGSLFYNYKQSFSIILLAVVDANYKFIAIDVGAYGRNSDGGVFSNSNFGKRLQSGELNIPEDKVLPGSAIVAPHVFVGDEAFPLTKNLMRPYPGARLPHNMKAKIFNYRLSRARRIVENCFGILSQKFRIYQRKLKVLPENLDKIVLATCCLHNFIQDDVHSLREFDDVMEEQSRGLENLAGIGGSTNSQSIFIREKFADYFNSEYGRVEWQEEIVNRGKRNN